MLSKCCFLHPVSWVSWLCLPIYVRALQERHKSMTGAKIYRNMPKIVVHKSLGDMRCNVYYTLLGRRRIKGLAQLKKFTPFYLLNGTIVISGEFELNFQKIVGRPPQGGEKISVMTKDHFKILARKIWRLQKLL